MDPRAPGPDSTDPSPISVNWPHFSPVHALAERRQRLGARLQTPVLLASGWPRARNFPHNQHSFRAESHFLYLVGRALPGAALLISDAGACLYVPQPDPDSRLWHGPEPSLAELADLLGLPVRPTAELSAPPGTATIPPQCPRAAAWLTTLLGRPIVAGCADGVEGPDARLADALIALRLVHDASAVDQLRQAAAVTVQAHRAGMRATRVGDREARVSAAMEAEITGCGMALSYCPIVTVGGEVLHAHTHERVMAEGDLLLADVGAETPEGWAADVTRTWPVSGRFSPTQRDLYQAVLDAQTAAIASVRPGAPYTQVHDTSQRVLTERLECLGILRGSVDSLMACHAVSLFYPHGSGHLLGLDVHDMEDLGDRAGYAPGRQRRSDPARRFLRLDRELQPGMLVTVEPGFYQIPDLLESVPLSGPLHQALNRERLKQFSDVRGIRIEDDVLVTQTGSHTLSEGVPREIRQVEALIGG